MRVHVASANTKWMTELCIRSMHRFAGYPFELYVGDVGSHDGSIEMLRGLARQGFITKFEIARGGRQHAAWIDAWRSACDRRYAVFVDSDILFRGAGWLQRLVDKASGSHAALVCAEFQRGGRRYSGMNKRLFDNADRPAPHLLLLDVPQLRGLTTSFSPRVDEPAVATEAAFRYDTGALFFEELQRAGLPWKRMPRGYRSAFLHFGGMSWRPPGAWPTWSRARMLVKIRAAVMLHRTIWRSPPAPLPG